MVNKISKRVNNLVIPQTTHIKFERQENSPCVVVMYIEIEKSIITKNYEKDSYRSIWQPIERFNKDSDFAKAIRYLYNINLNNLFE